MSPEKQLNISTDWPGKSPPTTKIRSEVENNYRELLAGEVPGADFLGWLHWPQQIDPDLLQHINQISKEVKEEAELFISTGIGGSYLGARAVIEALRPFDEITAYQPEIAWAGNQLSGNYHLRLQQLIDQKSTYLNVISKSGTTTETALAFRLLRESLEEKYSPEECRKRIVVTTSRDRGALVDAARENGYRRFTIPADIGGRFSVLTPVGLFPISVADISINKLIEGAEAMADRLTDSLEGAKTAIKYAVARNTFYRQGGKIELLASFYPELSYVGDWWQQLFGESEGKTGEGLYPATVNFTTDLHSLGQYVQEGPNHLLETIPVIKQRDSVVEVPDRQTNEDGLNYLASRSLTEINEEALAGTREAHLAGGTPVITLEIPRLNEYWLGGLLYFFQFSCALSALTLGVNPFNQPGVEAYKENMYRRLEKPGYN